MTTVAAKAPIKNPFVLLLGLTILLFATLAGLSSWVAYRQASTQVPLRPCLSCPSCSCPKTLGSVKCLCPR